MRIAYVGYHHPEREGSAAGRQLWAVGEALIDAGHDVTAWCWRPEPPGPDAADWCEWRPVPTASPLRVRSRGLLRPRSEVVRAGWAPPDDAVVLADDPGSWPAAAGQGRLAVPTVHFSVRLDRSALGWTPKAVQDLRGERRAVRQAPEVWALSGRVRDAIGRGRSVPACIPLPDAVLPVVEEPVVGLLADWSWIPNVTAADRLVRSWPEVRRAVPGARLLLAGRGPCPVGAAAGVEWLGEVATSADLLAQVAVFAFPCPPTSGPKMKVLDAMAHGVAVVTTSAGVEGISSGEAAAVVASEDDLPARLVDLLRDPADRARRAVAGRDVLERHHAPAVAAQIRIGSLEAMLSPSEERRR